MANSWVNREFEELSRDRRLFLENPIPPFTCTEWWSVRTPRGKHCIAPNYLHIKGLYFRRRIANKVGELGAVLHAKRVDFVCLSEHWMTIDQAAYLSVSGYRLISSFCRQDLIRGGTAILTKENIPWLYSTVSGYHVISSFCRQDLIRGGTAILTKENVPWLYSTVSGYHVISSFCRQDLIRGGTAILTKKNVPWLVKPRDDLDLIRGGTAILTKENVPWLVKPRDDLVQHSQELHFEVAAVSVPELRTPIATVADWGGDGEPAAAAGCIYFAALRSPPELQNYYRLLRGRVYELEIEREIITDPLLIASSLNDTFANVADRLAHSLPHPLH
ncbi:hypothetical protein J6590_078536 [Homalodisca vitripennis]|nr:hypothetical protein J6590_078536 [Homalodisca vitripennis]